MATLPSVDSIVEAEVHAGEPGAAVTVIQNGEVIHAKGYGLANVEWAIPIDTDTVFRLASLTKQFTATAIMMLVEEGKLSVDDSITRFFPKYPTSGHSVTVEQLLNHTSGIFSYTSDPEFGSKMQRDLTPQQMSDEFSKIPFDFKPGSRYQYNNSAYILLGMIIEQVSGMSYGDYIEQAIFQPLGMKQSGYLSSEPIIPKRASGYQPTPEGGFVNAPYLSMTQPYAAGALGSTVNDLVLWDKALRENSLIRAETLEQMVSPGTLEDGSALEYGYGWGVQEYQRRAVANHSGGIPGFSTFIARFYEDGITIIVLSNRVGFPIAKVTAAIFRQVAGIAEPVRTEITLDDAALEKVVGTYQYETLPIPVTRGENGSLLIQIGREVLLKPQSATEFYSPSDADILVTFSDADEEGFKRVKYQGAFMSFAAKRGESVAE